MDPYGAGVAGIKPLRMLDANEAIQEELMRYIRREGLGPGDRLPSEARLAQALNVSRATLREAMRSMEAAGLIKARKGSGWYVQDFSFGLVAKQVAHSFQVSKHQLSDLKEIRVHLECSFVDQAMQSLTPDDLEVLEQAVSEMETMAARGQPFVQQDHLFHTRLFARVPNQLFGKVMDLFWNLSLQLVRASIPVEDLVESARNHRLTLAAIRMNDAALARQRLFESFGGPPPFWSVDSNGGA